VEKPPSVTTDENLSIVEKAKYSIDKKGNVCKVDHRRRPSMVTG
jgi:hypothetical protein